MNRARLMRRTAMPVPPARSACASQRAARARPTSSPASQRLIWTPSRWSPSPATSAPASSAETPSRRSTSPASPCRSPSITFVVRHVEELADTDPRGVPHRSSPAVRVRCSSTFPKDVTAATTASIIPKSRVEVHETYDISEEQLKTVADMIAQGRAPDHLLRRRRGDLRTRAAALLALMRKAEIPSAHTMMAIGCVPDDDAAEPRHGRHARHGFG